MKQTEDFVYEIQPPELMIGLIEVIRETQKQIGYYEMKEMANSHLGKTIKPSLEKTARHLSEREIVNLAAKLHRQLMMKGTIQALSALSEYQAEAKRMTTQAFRQEIHDSKRLAKHLKAAGHTRHPNVAAHAIVSGCHPEARAARRILAKFRIRIDDPDNGVFLPRDSRFIPHEKMPDAANHASVHTDQYYINVTNILSTAKSESECRMALKLVAKKLREGSMEYS